MYIIGLTGNIGTGKSTVGKMLAGLGARYIDADRIAHRVMQRGQPAYQAVVAEFGENILDAKGEIDRAKLGSLVFGDPARLERLEQIVHPVVLQQVAQEVARAQEPVVVLDAIKLIESGMNTACDVLWVVTCREEQQVARLMKTRGMTETEALLRIRSQPPQEEKVRLADVVIDNSGSLARTRRQVLSAWKAIPGAGRVNVAGGRQAGGPAPGLDAVGRGGKMPATSERGHLPGGG